MGSLFKRGKVFWIKYYVNGKPYRESSHSKKETDAKRLLKLREGQGVEGRFPGLKVERIRFVELAEDYLTDYRVNEKKSLVRAEECVWELKNFFGDMRAVEITSDKVNRYIEKRQDDEMSNASINRELSALKRMFSLGMQQTPPKVVRCPHIPRLEENNVRSGFFERNDFLRLRSALPDYLKPVITMAFNTGMRKGEILSLTWDKVDFFGKKITLSPDDTKNKKSRTLFLEEELYDVIVAQKKRCGMLYPTCPYVFSREGKKIGQFVKTWKSACIAVGLKGKLFHDFRRTAIRNMVRAGIPDKIAMAMSGHKTRSVYDRYNIINEEDLKLAAKDVAEYIKETDESLEQQRHGHKMGTICNFSQKRGEP